MAEPGFYPLRLTQGDSYHWRFQLWQDADKSRPVDLAGAEAEATIGPLRVKCPIELPNTIRLDLHPAETEVLAGPMLWALRLKRDGGEVKTIVRGNVTVTVNA